MRQPQASSETRMRTLSLSLAAVVAVAAAPVAAHASDVTVKELNSGAAGAMVYEPAFVQVKPGDTVHFVPADPGHDVESIDGMAPAGAAKMKSAYGKPYDVTFTQPGLYGYKCGVHFAMGMVGVVVVGGKPANLSEAMEVKVPGLAKQRMPALLQQAAAVTEPKAAAKTKRRKA